MSNSEDELSEEEKECELPGINSSKTTDFFEDAQYVPSSDNDLDTELGGVGHIRPKKQSRLMDASSPKGSQNRQARASNKVCTFSGSPGPSLSTSRPKPARA